MARLIRLVLAVGLLFAGAGTATAQTVSYVDSAHPFQGPLAYRDPNNHVTYYVESDGRHVAAISEAGVLLWTRNPFEDGHLEPYRNAHPRIVFIGDAGNNRPKDALGVTFDSSQFGWLDPSNGDFHFGGQD